MSAMFCHIHIFLQMQLITQLFEGCLHQVTAHCHLAFLDTQETVLNLLILLC